MSVVSFGTSGAFVKPLLHAGWSPGAAVAARALLAGLVLLPFTLWSLHGQWDVLWRGRWRVLGMGVVAVAFTQLTYFAALTRIPVATALLVEYLAPLLLVGATWALTRRRPGVTVLLGSALAVGGLVLVVGPGAVQAVDPLGLAYAFAAAVGCAVYFVVAARPAQGLSPVALAGSGLLLAGVLLFVLGLLGLMPFTAHLGEVELLGTATPWWVPLLVVAVVGTAVAYSTGVAASNLLGARLASFLGLLEVVSASVIAWLLLGEALSPLQLLGGLLILGGIAAVRAEPAERPVAGTSPQAWETPAHARTGPPA
ncbi:drug/metabolite transporter (DMT)-like permease [Crossiella equi]|uniref:Drug/metabolite transporter (DMT)-like permease n=1 Tax=Crossiella equi TaxID=130796 RepID=A0ABS5ARE7_9PSEU|nr:drug/metabolite transporter (DMT)-like permease [Crossiella equi]